MHRIRIIAGTDIRIGLTAHTTATAVPIMDIHIMAAIPWSCRGIVPTVTAINMVGRITAA